MNQRKNLNQRRERRKKRAHLRTRGNSQKPRLSVFRSNNYIYAQLIDDENQRTLVSASSRQLAEKGESKPKTVLAEKIGEKIAEEALKKGIRKVIFDKGAYRYHGRVKAVAEGARKKGLNF